MTLTSGKAFFATRDSSFFSAVLRVFCGSSRQPMGAYAACRIEPRIATDSHGNEDAESVEDAIRRLQDFLPNEMPVRREN